MGLKDMAAKAKEKLSGHGSEAHQGVRDTGDKFDEATGGRHSNKTDRAQEAVNERLDQYLDDESSRRNRGPGM